MSTPRRVFFSFYPSSMASISTTITAAGRSLHSHSPTIRAKLTVSQISSPPPVSLRSLLLPAGFRRQIRPISSKPTRVSPLACRASAELPTGIRPGGSVESDKLPSDLRKQAMDAVDSCGGRVTIGDVASKAGLKLNEADKALQALAADTGGFLEVSDEGDVLYVFPKDYRSKLAAKSFRIKLEPLLDKLKGTSEYIIRVSFGTALIMSIVVVYTTIIALVSSRSEDDNRGGGRRGGRAYDSGVTVFFSPTDLFWYWDPYYYRRRQARTADGMNFIESVFSFVFGDGDPNHGLESERWKLIGEYISSNGGVVTAEELAPYLDLELMEKATDDDSYILPVLLRFDGRPEVDEEGNILYRFPSLQRTALSQRAGRREYVGRKWAEWVDGKDRFLEEKKWLFSKTNASEKAMVVGLGALNLFGVIVLGSMLKNVAVAPSGFISLVSDIFPILQVYAASFFAIPVVRWFFFNKKNEAIVRRNVARKQRAKALELPDAVLRRKMMNARDMAKRTTIGSNRIVYSTEKDVSDQDYEAKEWNSRFRELERSD